jgi:hypothetical protein
VRCKSLRAIDERVRWLEETDRGKARGLSASEGPVEIADHCAAMRRALRMWNSLVAACWKQRHDLVPPNGRRSAAGAGPAARTRARQGT